MGGVIGSAALFAALSSLPMGAIVSASTTPAAAATSEFEVPARDLATSFAATEREGTGLVLDARWDDDQAMPSHGRFTIDAATGRVLASELIAENGSLRAQIDVTYAIEPAMGMLVPREMREKYTLKDGSKLKVNIFIKPVRGGFVLDPPVG